VLATSLLDVQEFSAEEISKIYSQRWQVEEKIKALKGRAVIERFTGKSAQAVEQDFHAKILATNLVQLLVNSAQAEVDRDRRSRKHVWKINLTQALSKSKGVLALLLRVRSKIIAWLLDIFVRTLEPVRPVRSFPRRVSRVKVQTHCFAYAPCR
jgi:Transposase DDE domain